MTPGKRCITIETEKIYNMNKTSFITKKQINKATWDFMTVVSGSLYSTILDIWSYNKRISSSARYICGIKRYNSLEKQYWDYGKIV